MNTMFTPKAEKKENLETWRSGDGGIRRQLDYIVISEERKNWVKSTRTKGQATINQMYRNKILRMEINISLKQEKEKEGHRSTTT